MGTMDDATTVKSGAQDSGGHDARRGIGSIEVGMRLLDTLVSADGPMQLKQIAKAAEMAPAKVHRYLASFIAAGMVTHTGESGRYDLGPMAMRVGVAALRRFDVVERACGGLTALRDEIHATCFIASWSDKGPIIIRWEDSLRPLTVIVEVGSTMPLFSSATGRAFLAFMPPERTAKVVEHELGAGGSAAAAERAQAEALMDQIRHYGFGRTYGDFQTGIAAIAAPLFDPLGGMVAAVTALGREGEFDAAPDGAVARKLKEFATALSNAE